MNRLIGTQTSREHFNDIALSLRLNKHSHRSSRYSWGKFQVGRRDAALSIAACMRRCCPSSIHSYTNQLRTALHIQALPAVDAAAAE